MNINDADLVNGPIVAVMNRGEGSWIQGKGDPVFDDKDWTQNQDLFEEIKDSIDIMIKNAKNQLEGRGGTPAPRNGGVSVNGKQYPY